MQSLPDINELMKIAASPAGQKLLSMLQNSPEVDLTKLAQEASSGNMLAVKRQLSGILASEDAQRLLKQLDKSHE